MSRAAEPAVLAGRRRGCEIRRRRGVAFSTFWRRALLRSGRSRASVTRHDSGVGTPVARKDETMASAFNLASARLWRPVSSAAGQEPVDLGQEVFPGGIVLRQQVVAAVEWDQTTLGDQRSQHS